LKQHSATNALLYIGRNSPDRPGKTGMKITQNLSPTREFPLKRFFIGIPYMLLCVLLSAALSACPSPNEGGGTPLEEVYTVIFDKNGGHTEANPSSKTVERHMSTIDALPEAPTREGYKFLGWNTQADGSGSVFTANTLVRENLTVYAQWENLDISILPSAETLTPIIDGAYNEHSTRFRMVVSGFKNPADASKASLDIEPISGLSFEVESNTVGNTQTFEVSVEYNGQTAFPEGFATIILSFLNISGYSAESQSTRIDIRDGQAASPNRAIPVNQANIGAFNRYANTAAGLTRHYRLTENISLAEPAQPTESNWTAIGTELSPFMGSLNGENHELLRLHIRASGRSLQGLFGHIGEGATLENIRLTEASVNGGNQVGGLVGWNAGGTVQNSYATGSVYGSGYYVGGLVGYNYGTVQNSYATGSVSGSDMYVGGLVGSNYGTVQNSYATGSVSGDSWVGGLVGSNYGNSTVQNSYATGSVSGIYRVGGLVGHNNYGGTVQNSLALNPRVSGINSVGRVAGINENNGTLTNNHAFSGMLNSAGNTSWSNIGFTNLDGANLSAAALQIANGFPSAFTTTPWRYLEGRLPGLFGQTVDMPAHLAPP